MTTTSARRPYHLYLPAGADKVAATLQAQDKDWIYTPVHDPQGWLSYILITDHDGAVIGKY